MRSLLLTAIAYTVAEAAATLAQRTVRSNLNFLQNQQRMPTVQIPLRPKLSEKTLDQSEGLSQIEQIPKLPQLHLGAAAEEPAIDQTEVDNTSDLEDEIASVISHLNAERERAEQEYAAALGRSDELRKQVEALNTQVEAVIKLVNIAKDPVE